MIYAGFETCYSNGSATAGFSPVNVGDILMCAFDQATGKVWFGVNGAWLYSGNPSAGSNATFTISNTLTVYPASTLRDSDSIDVNFGARSFAYTAPSGFKALCTTNLPAPLVTKPSTVMDVKLYTGNGTSQSITGLGFSPDFIWIKNRTRGTANHALYDIVRGRDPVLASNTTAAELTGASASEDLTSFNSDGFSLGTIFNGDLNRSTEPYVAWCWDAGTSTVTNTQGSITSSVRANATAGFSVVSVPGYTYPTKTAGHGLGVEPHFIITKSRGVSNPWIIYHKSAGANTYFQFDTGAGYTGVSGVWSGVSSTVFPLNSGVNQQTDIIAYCFAPVVGYSSFGSYTGNGASSDGPFVFTGMRPRFVLLKRTDSTGNWVIWDAVRNAYNVANSILLPNSSAAEFSPDAKIDILSNGFKIRDNSSDSNVNGATYVYAAFAEAPLNYSRAR
jgi:hypothetical protein